MLLDTEPDAFISSTKRRRNACALGRSLAGTVEFERELIQERIRAGIAAGRATDATAIYLFTGDGDPSLDAGCLAMRIGECCELPGNPRAAEW